MLRNSFQQDNGMHQLIKIEIGCYVLGGDFIFPIIIYYDLFTFGFILLNDAK